MLRPQDVVILTKIIINKDVSWTQLRLANELCMSSSQINAAIKRLVGAKLLTPYIPSENPMPVLPACKEFFIHGVKYCFPAQVGQLTRGIPTSYAAPSFNNQILTGKDPVPVWPHGEGTVRGIALIPLYSTVAESVIRHPDEKFYALLSLIDAVRTGRARERSIAAEKISEILQC